MFTLFAVLIATLMLTIAGADVFLSEFNADELSNMGIEHE